jgi:YjbE family integral membrane protein
LDFEFIRQLLIIVGIDIVLGGDNALVIALASRNLPKSQRNKAIFLGTGLAIFMRIMLTIVALYLLKIPYLQLAGGILLIWIAYKLLVEDGGEASKIKGGTTLFQAVRTIVFADIIMGFDNVLAIAGAAHHDISLVIFGLLISIPIIIWGSKIILVLMDRFPILIYFGAGILAYTAGTMITHEEQMLPILENNEMLSIAIPLLTILFVLFSGWVSKSFRFYLVKRH